MTAPSLLSHAVAWGAWAAARGWDTARAAAGLPPTCRQAVAHAALVCTGADPVYFSAGFAPLSLAWGWLLLGLALGVLLRPVLAAWGPTLLHRVVATPVLAQREPSRPTAAEVRANAAAEVLRCVALGGENELRALAAGAGLSPAALAAALAAPGLEAGGAGSTPAAFPGGSAAPAPAQPATLSRPRRRVRAA